ncbi:hypothetical protein AZE42_01404 [Rhizopogon vesiculosus]|uniref:DUF221-domain-containing protein n=1 Tax=Rhizopogon vesiculosus TaxID=180088 RepID=A0A1J8PL32_9AGAM|nr:hypothetical protein AZE42_01404 [Rhizopogon vesiculosus]
MSDIQDRLFSKDYSGLINQSLIAIVLAVVSVTSHEIMKRKRRGHHAQLEGLGSVESWQFGYLYQGRIPPFQRLEAGHYPGSRTASAFLKKSSMNLEESMQHYTCDSCADASMIKASISSLVETQEGFSLLWIHVCLLFWITLTWIGNLFYICNGAFKFRAAKIESAMRSAESDAMVEREAQYHPHPHPQYPFQDIPSMDVDRSNRGLRLRTVMVTNIPVPLRSEKELKEYFEYYLSRSLDKPSVGLPASKQPGFLNKLFAFVFNRAKRIPQNMNTSQRQAVDESQEESDGTQLHHIPNSTPENIPVIERVVIALRMTELASLLERREDILRRSEAAHIRLANKALLAAYNEVERRRSSKEDTTAPMRTQNRTADIENGFSQSHDEQQNNMDILVRTLAPFLDDYELTSKFSLSRRKLVRKVKVDKEVDVPSKENIDTPSGTIWDALLSLPPSVLNPYQPLIHLSVFFRGKTAPSIDYYTVKLKLLTSLIMQNRAKAAKEYHAVSTAFVTFKDPADAKKACKYLAVHPDNPLACLVTMAPQYEDIDWKRVMWTTYRVDILKDWVVNVGVWAFTIFWIFPVTLFVGLVSIQSISTFWPSLYNYLSSHPWEEEVIQSFLPTILISLLMMLIPLILLLIAKKAHTIITLSAMHDRIMTRYYKFLIVNVLVFFCVGTAAVQSFLTSLKAVSGSSILNTVATSFTAAGPFYVGWLIFTTAIHGSFELAMFGLPLFTYPSTKRQVTPRKRAVGTRPRTFNFYYWLPNHLLVIHVLLLFALLNPLVLPFGLIYFSVETGWLFIYCEKSGLMLAQFVFLAYMAVLHKTANMALAAVLFVLTAITKIIITRMVAARFEQDDIQEAQVVCRTGAGAGANAEDNQGTRNIPQEKLPSSNEDRTGGVHDHHSRFQTWRLPAWINFSYSTFPRRLRPPAQRQPNPFGPHTGSFSRLHSLDENKPTVASTQETPPVAALGSPLHSSPAEELFQPPACISPSLVQRHPPLAAWDDEPRHDIPYDNPYYTKPISNALWLPRDPLGLLDLDDTVDVYRALTTELCAGDVGSTTPTSPLPSSVTSEEPPSILASRRYSGREDIDLPEGIKSRANVIDLEDDMESTRPRRPSLFSRNRSGSSASVMSNGNRASRDLLRRSQTIDGSRSQFPFPRKSSFECVPARSRERAISYLPPPDLHPHSQYHGVDPGSRPDLHAQADFARSMHSIMHGGSRATLPHPANVTTREAVVTEAIAEEQLATEERLRKEQAHAQLHRGSIQRAWFTSWIYARNQ